MDDLLVLSLLRMIERLVSVLIGGLAIYLGYRLFINLPDLPSGDGNFGLPGGTSLMLTRVGPGVFFSLFGAVVVGVALSKPLAWDRSGQPGASTVRFSAATQVSSASDASLSTRRDAVETAVGDLNLISGLLSVSVGDDQRGDIRRAVEQAKLALIGSVWSDEWGDRSAFERWAITGGPPPPAAKDAARIHEKRKAEQP